MRNARAQGSPSGLNQTSANFSPRNFKAAHCSEGGCSENFNSHLRRLRTNHHGQFGRRKKRCDNLSRADAAGGRPNGFFRSSHWLPIVTPSQEGGKSATSAWYFTACGRDGRPQGKGKPSTSREADIASLEHKEGLSCRAGIRRL